MFAVSVRDRLQPAKAPLDQTKRRSDIFCDRRVDLRRRAPWGVRYYSMIALHGSGFLPRLISVRKHDRPMRHRESSTASKMFFFIQFDCASNDGLKFFKFARPKHSTQL